MSSPAALATPAGTTNPANANYLTEIALLHTPLNASRLGEILVWDAADANWRKPKPDETTPSASDSPLVVLHLWATWCLPCREELAVLRDLGPAIEARYHRRVRFVYIAVDTGSADMERFLPANKDRMPATRMYLDAGRGGLADTIRNRLISGKLSLPITLLVDQQRIIRQAIVGPINNRRAELVDSIERLFAISGAGLPR